MRVSSTLEQLRQQYGNDVRLVWKHFVVHPQVATTPALATCAAHKQGKFFELERMIWEKSWPGGSLGDLGEDTMTQYATALKLDLGRFKADMAGDACRDQINGDQRQMAQLGTRGTPAFYINGRFLSGAQPIENFKAVIDEELQKATTAIKAGRKPEEYYGSIVANGKKSI
jgi:protein-disulfide isomerase